MKIKANLLNKPVNFQMDDCQIEKVVELPRDQFSALVITPLTNQPFIAENKRWMFADNSAVHCLLALGQGSDDGVLIYSGGYDYPRLAAYLPGMRDILNARLERAADFIVHQGTEATENGSWSISCEELEKQTGITVRRGNGLDGMLLEALMRRSEVASVSMTDTGIDMAYHLNFCPRIPGQKPCYFTKLPEEQKTQVFYEAVEVLLDFLAMRISMVYSTTDCKCRTRRSWPMDISPRKLCWPRAPSWFCRKTLISLCGTFSSMSWLRSCLSSMPRAESQYRLNRKKN